MLLVLALLGCGGQGDLELVDEAVWLEGLHYEWAWFNHRVSTIDVRVDHDAVHAAVIGGTSTTGVPRDLDEACDPDGCKEFPFVDQANLVVRWGRVETSEVVLVEAEQALEVGAAGASATVSAPAPDREGAVRAVLRGFAFDTGHPLDGPPSCYDPAFGWHPRELGVVLSEPRREGDQLLVDVTGHFVAGNSLDPERQCIDEVNELAVLDVRVDVLFVVGDVEAQNEAVASEAYYPHDGTQTTPDPQEPPAPVSLSVPTAGRLLGWTAARWWFNPDVAEERGAYLRTLGFEVLPEGSASGTATNYSPGTHLWDFGYAFEGAVQSIAVGGTVTRGTVEETLEAALDEGGEPVVFTLPY